MVRDREDMMSHISCKQSGSPAQL